jgi:lactate racemase
MKIGEDYMSLMNIRYGNSSMEFNIQEKNLMGILAGKDDNKGSLEEEIILNALKNPIGTNKLKEKVAPGYSVCVVISDITRSWQRTDIYLPYIIKELNDAGIEDKDITILSANGSHRKQSEEEHRILIGEDLYKRFRVYDHDCFDEVNMTYLGTTSFGTPVSINKMALKCDTLVITGAVVFHDMAGFGGGRKSILPGISAHSTIMANHSLSLSITQGCGSNKLTGSRKLIGNPIHEDMMEAALMVRPDFLFNVVINEEGKISYAAAGDFIKAHKNACSIVEKCEVVGIEEKADIVIASAGGYPKDINLYQGSKTLTNAKEAVKEGGTIIIACECREGFGDDEMEFIIRDFNDNLEREKNLRESYTIAKYTGFLVTEIAEKYRIILVTSLKSEALYNAGISIMDRIDTALEEALKDNEKAKIYIMTHASSTLPVLSEK